MKILASLTAVAICRLGLDLCTSKSDLALFAILNFAWCWIVGREIALWVFRKLDRRDRTR